jgi:nucleoside-diphosphate-sugar epimerase
VIPRFIAAALDGTRPVVFGDGEQSRDFTYIENVVEANLLALDSSAGAGEMFNVACGERVTLNMVLGMLAELSGAELDADHRPRRAGEVRHSQADIQRARETFGYRASVPFAEGLRRTFEDMRSTRGQPAAAAG